MYLWAIRDKTTGKLRNDLTNPSHRFWEKEGSCRTALENYSDRKNYQGRRFNYGEILEVVKFELVER